ncbi:MAG: hypothetical protein LBN06_05865 [Prevotellaceae bacterium]|jgi:hypothetical protein|nr:hypothetical protein [Prevotellaceae bacterium]
MSESIFDIRALFLFLNRLTPEEHVKAHQVIHQQVSMIGVPLDDYLQYDYDSTFVVTT